MDSGTARDWLMLAYVIAELTEIAVFLAAGAAGLFWLGSANAVLLCGTVALRRRALRRLDGG